MNLNEGASSSATLCNICNEALQKKSETVVLTQKGAQSCQKISNERKSDLKFCENQILHKKCRQKWIDKKQIIKSRKECESSPEKTNFSRNSRSRLVFEFNKQCFYCAKLVGDPRARSKNNEKISAVKTVDLKRNLVDVFNNRNNDEWSQQVAGRLAYANDLHAVDAVYHHICNTNFRTFRNIPKKFANDLNVKSPIRGAKQNEIRKTTFLEVMDEFKCSGRTYKLCELVKEMQNKLNEKNCKESSYSLKYMKQCLENHFSSDLVVTKNKGKPALFTILTSDSIIHQDELKSNDLIKNVAKMIKNDILQISYVSNVYPTAAEISDISSSLTFLPISLLKLLEVIIGNKNTTVIASIGHAIVQATRPKSIIAPLQIGLGVQMHHQFASRFLIDSLNKSGFSSSYSEVMKYLRNASLTSSLDTNIIENQFVQFAADNVDHNVRTIDGLNTFHGMGMIGIFSPEIKQTRVVPRNNVSVADVTNNNQVPIIPYYGSNKEFQAFENFELSHSIDVKYYLPHLFYKVLPLVQCKLPGWSGYMNIVYNQPKAQKSSISFLPLIDMNPSDNTCIISTLTYLVNQADKNNATPIITFDQPLYWKANKIICGQMSTSRLRDIILMMGGLHTEMNFVGCIGYVMENSGLVEVLETVYAKNSIPHMMSGNFFY